MAKCKVNAKLISDEENLNVKTNGIKIGNKITYKENEISVTIVILNNKIEMKRVHKDYTVSLFFDKDKETISNYYFIGGNKVFELSTKTNKLIILDNKIEIDYTLEDNDFRYELELEDL